MDQFQLIQAPQQFTFQADTPTQPKQKPQASMAKRIAASLLPTVGGALGAVGGSFVAPVAGTVAGGAAGSALGEALRQKLLGEDTSVKKIATEGALGAVPGVFRGAKAGVQAVKTAKANKAASEAERAAQQLAEQARLAPKGIPVKYVDTTSTGTGVKQTVNKAFAGPTANKEMSQATQLLTKQGFITKQSGSTIPGRKSVAGASVFEPGKAESVYQVQGKRTAIPIKETSSTAEIIAPKAPAIGTQPIASEVPSTAAMQPAVPTAKPTLLNKLSTGATKRASGIKSDTGVGGIEKADEAAATFQRLGIAGSPSQQLRKINETIANHSKAVDDILAKNPIQIDGTAVKAQAAKAIDDPLRYADLDLSTPGAQRALNAHLDKFAQATTAKEVNDYVKTLNKVATRAQDKLARGITLTDKETAALAAKKSGDEVLSQYPEIKPYKKDMAVLFERNPDVTKQSEKTVGIPILGIKSRVIAQGGANITSRAGAAGAKLAQPSTNPGTTRKVAGALFGQWGTRAVAAPFIEDQSENNPTTQSAPQTTNDTTTMPTSISNIPTLNNESTPDASMSEIDYEAEARNALAQGDYKAFEAIMQLAAMAEKKATSGVNKPLSAEASKVIANANSGLQSLQELEQIMQADPSVLQKTVIPGRSAMGGAIANAAGTASYDTAARNISDVITRLRTGAALTESEEKFYRSQLPQAFDSPEVVQQKLNMFRDLFSSVANRTGTAGTDMAEAVQGIQ